MSDIMAIAARVAEPSSAEEQPGTSWDALDLEQVLGDPKPSAAPEFLSRTDGLPLLYPKRINAIYGEPECGKSFLAALAVAELITADLPVAFFDFEDEASLLCDRLSKMGIDGGQLARNLRYVNPAEPLTPENLTRVRRVLEGVALAIIDATGTSMANEGLDPDRNADVLRWLLKLPAEVQRAGCAGLVLDHVTKSKENRGRWAIGAGAKLGAIRGASYSMTLRREFGVGLIGSASLVVSKDRPGQVRRHTPDRKSVGTFIVDSRDPDHIVARIEPAEPSFSADDGLSRTQRRVLDVLPSSAVEAIGWREIGDRLAARDPEWPLKKPTILAAAAALVELGHADEAATDGRGSKVFWTGAA